MSSYQPIDNDSQSWSSHDVLFGGSTDQERMIEQGAGITVLIFVSLTLLFSIINTHKSGAHFMLGLIITGFALCLGHLLRAWRNGDLDPKFKYFILTQTVLLTLLCIIANVYFWQ
ncbi:hypothetical protein BG015_008714 [Linnemannia schmuckeri]|uniref:Uncharacterized protein n=1 Tax=Linnemannia schmuckeri TaxID=64567 RepID=A0A9P5S055_9FUNG|nr:hypothetical protein BG015_008714 [Linnemannia schmuckeri]